MCSSGGKKQNEEIVLNNSCRPEELIITHLCRSFWPLEAALEKYELTFDHVAYITQSVR